MLLKRFATSSSRLMPFTLAILKPDLVRELRNTKIDPDTYKRIRESCKVQNTVPLEQFNDCSNPALCASLYLMTKWGCGVAAYKMVWLSNLESAGFYCQHTGKPYYTRLMALMTRYVLIQV